MLAEDMVRAELTRRNALAGLPPPGRIGITRGYGPFTEREVADSVIEALDAIGRGEFEALPLLGDSHRRV